MAFNVKDIGLVIQMVKRISDEGVGVIYIAHDLEEIIEVADRITVLRDGKAINTHNKKLEQYQPDDLAKEMIGRPVDLFFKKKESPVGDYVFEVRDLKIKESAKPISFRVREGEILGVVGKNGCGKSTLLKLISSVLTPNEGTVVVNGKISALLELGSGFNPEFSGMQNIFFYGSIVIKTLYQQPNITLWENYKAH